MKNIPNEDNFMENSNHKIDDEKKIDFAKKMPTWQKLGNNEQGIDLT